MAKLSHEQTKLVEDNIKLVRFTIYKYHRSLINDDDIYQIGCIGLINAASKYNKELGCFSSYAVLAIRTEIFKHFRGMKMDKRKSLDEALSIETKTSEDFTLQDTLTDIHDYFSDVVFGADYEKFYNSLTPKEKQVIDLKLQGYNGVEIAKMTGTTRQWSSLLLKNAGKKINKLY